MKLFKNKDQEQFVSTKAIITEFSDYNDKSYRFVATGMVLGVETSLSGFFAKSLGREYAEGEQVTVTVKAAILDGSDPSLENPGIPCNYLWSISRGGADDISDSQLAALKALLG